MKAVLDRLTGETCSASSASFVSERMMAYGHVDGLHTPSGTLWNPGWKRIELYLTSLRPADIPQNTTNIEGEFLIIYRAPGKVFIFNDRFSLARIYYRLNADSIELFDAILGEISGLRINQPAALAFLLFRYVPGHRTLFDGIYQLMPGECLVLELPGGGVRTENACAYPKIDLGPARMEELAPKIHAIFREAIETRLQNYPDNEPILLPLSGGFDSRYILGTLLELTSPGRIMTLTFGEPGTYDYEIGRMVAEAAGVRHAAYPLTTEHYNEVALAENAIDTQASVSFSAETPLDVYRCLAEYGQVLMSGNPGGGPFGQMARVEPERPPRQVMLEDALTGPDDPLNRYLDDAIVEESWYHFRIGRPTCLVQFEHFIFTNHVPKYSVPCVYKLRQQITYISPFCDYAFTDMAHNLPVELRLNRKLYLYWLDHHFHDLASLPCAWFKGVPFNASPLRKFINNQWDRFQVHVLGINRRANKIDWVGHQSKMIDMPRLSDFAAEVFPPEVSKELLKPAPFPRNLVLYSLKSLEILRSNFGVAF